MPPLDPRLRAPHRPGHRVGQPGLLRGRRPPTSGSGPGTHHTEGSQAARLVEVARRYRVGAVVLQVGANDDAALIDTGIACILAFLDPAVRPCRETIGPLVDARMSRHRAGGAGAALRDVRAGDAPGRLRRRRLPAGAGLVRGADHRADGAGWPPRQGCPYSRADAGWGAPTLFPALSAALRGVAERTGARFLDLSRATEGREACSRATPAQEWQRRITVDPKALRARRVGRGRLPPGPGVVPPERGGARRVRVAAWARSCGPATPSAACVAGPDGRLRLTGEPAGGPARRTLG